MDPWLTRLRHDLLKRAVWPARDLREMLEAGRSPSAQDRRALRAGLFALQDGEGAPCDARLLWALLLASAPGGLDAAALEAFGAGVDSAMNVVGHAVPATGDAPSTRVLEAAIESVLALERLFESLAKSEST
jgi:hypothetical protein